MEKYGFTEEEWKACLKVMNKLKEDPFNNPDNELFSGLLVKIYKKAKKLKKDTNFRVQKELDVDVIKQSEIAKNALNNKTLYAEGEKRLINDLGYKKLEKPKNCYVCNNKYTKVHFFYSRLCPNCSEENYDARFSNIDLSGRKVIITGGRVKIGYATALKLLRSNADVTVTTRFPALAMKQFKEEKDYYKWKERLRVYGLDLRNLKEVKNFVEYYKSKERQLDILINNAAQTIKYTNEYYLPLVVKEQDLLLDYESDRCLVNKTPLLYNSKELINKEVNEYYEFNRFGQPVDNRNKTSWNSTLEEISVYELLEVNLINQISPYFLIKELTPLLYKSNFKQKFIINVTSSEGQFSYHNKTIYHPHTNMTKAALNMLTRTSSKEYLEKYAIYMYAVDVGWISTGAKEVLRNKQFEEGYIPPLDSVDGASRILHPIIKGIKEKHILVGTLLKNYKIEEW